MTDDALPPHEQPPRKRRRRRRRGGGGAAGKGAAAAAGAPPEPAVPTDPPAPAREGAGTNRRRRPAKKGGAGQTTRSAKGAGARTAKTTKTKGKGAGRGQGGRHIPTTREVSAGGVVYRRIEDDGIEVVLASRRTRRGQLAWGLAKGGIEDGETKEQAAVREVREETGLTAVIEADLGDTKYIYVWEDVRIRKTVHFFLMRHTGGDVEDRDDEMEEIRWFPMDRAVKRAAYRGERDMLQRATELLR